MTKQSIIHELQKLTNHSFVEVVRRGNVAIKAALKTIPKDKKVIIPEEGGWLSYKTIPKELRHEIIEVKCDDSKINLHDLHLLLKTNQIGAILYQNPAGYFAQQEQEGIYKLCQEHNCIVIKDVSGSIGTELCNGEYADYLVASFGEWKLVEARGGGFISAKNSNLWNSLSLTPLDDQEQLTIILHHLKDLPTRITYLNEIRDVILQDLKHLPILHPNDTGFVVVIEHKNQDQKETIINYCAQNNLKFTECPRYIRVNKNAISIEVKRENENN